jgi:hypothetical protein
MNISDVLPDGNFNGTEVLWLLVIGMAAWLAAYAARRAESDDADVDTVDRPSGLDRDMDEFFGPDAFAWPARSAHAPDRST